MLDALPGHVGDVQQAVDAAEVHERTVIGEILDHALDRRAFLQIVEERRALGAVFLLHDGAPRYHDVVALLVELDDFEFERLVLEVRGIPHRPYVDQRAGQKRTHVVDLDGEAALDPAGDDAGDHFLLLEGRLQARPGARPLGLLARQPGLARAVLDAVERDLDGLADVNFDFALLVLELIRGYDGLGLQTDIDDYVILADLDDEAVEYGAGTNPLARDTLFKQFRKTFCHVLSIERCPGSFPCAPGVDRNDGDPILDLRNQISAILSHQEPAGSRVRAISRTRLTTALTGIPVVSSTTASALATRGEAEREISRRSRSAISSERAARVAATPFSFNWL